MCGICGIYNLNGKSRVSESTITEMCDQIIHRGPDDQGVFTYNMFGHGMRRLSIIDLDGGHQPIYSHDNTYSIVFNGEIYNYIELRLDLKKKGYKFKTHSDTETILYAYIEYGEACLQKLNGMFAFSIYNKKEDTLFLARDRMGIKPLYYYLDQKQFVYGSEIKSILKAPGIKRKISPRGLDLYLSFGYIPAPHSIFENIYKLDPGFYISIKNGELKKKKYWEMSYHPDYNRSEASFKEEFYSLFEDAIRIRMRSDVPFGAFLSGGIDSSLIVALMQKISTKPIKTFSLGYSDDPFYDETPFAEKVAKQFSTSHHAFKVDSSILPELIGMFTDHFDEPFADYSAFPTYVVSKYAREHVKVVLTGDGGDEVFAGYKRYYAELLAHYYSGVPQSIRNHMVIPVLSFLNKRIPASRYRDYVDFAIKKTNMMNLSPGERYYESLAHNHLTDFDKERLYRKSFDWDRTFVLEDFLEDWNSGTDDDYLGRRQFVDFKNKLPDDMLTKVDRMTMAVSLEARIPFLDHRIVEFSTKIPSNMKMSIFTMKRFLKKVSSDYLSDDIINRHKHGFSSPIDKWFRQDLRDFAFDHFNSTENKLSHIIDYSYINALMDKHLNREANLGNKLFNLLVLHLWANKYLEGK